MPRPAHTLLSGALVILAAANVAVFVQQRGHAWVAPGPSSAEARWQALSAGDRVAYARRYEELARSEDAGAILRRARSFARLPAAEQERLRALQAVFQSTVEGQSAARRREILLSPPRARAYLVYQAIAEQDPTLVEQLRARWAGRR